jgi:hypothetical protein
MPLVRPFLAHLALPLLWAAAGWGCAPKANTAPLGLGPLAVAEQSAASAEKSAAKTKQARTPRPASAAATGAVVSTEAAADEDEKPSAEDVSEVSEGDSPASKDAPAFAGLFAGKDVAIYRISGMAERQEMDDKAKLRIESDSPTQLRIVLINTTDGSDLCELSAEIQGNSNSAQLDGGQPCFTAEGEGAIQAELNSGTVTLAGDRLSMTAEGTLSVALAEQELDGKLSYSFKGKRQ